MPTIAPSVHDHGNYPNLTICDHPLLIGLLSKMRDVKTSNVEFGQLLQQVAPFLAYEAIRSSLSLVRRTIQTPTGVEMDAQFLDGTNIVLVSILGAGQGLVNEIRKILLPEAMLSYIGIKRNETTLQPKQEYTRLPDPAVLRESLVICVDPMLATGGSASAAISLLKERGARRIIFVSLIAAPEGVERMYKDHYQVKVLTLALDEKLNEKGYIVPGLGDAGDRYHGTAPFEA